MMDSPLRVSQWIAHARREFSAAGLDDTATDARMLVGGVLSLSNTEIVAGVDRIVGPDEAAALSDAISRRLTREPVHRILGRRAFHGLELGLSAATLEPRPDTEILVDRMLSRLGDHSAEVRILDLGTGRDRKSVV